MTEPKDLVLVFPDPPPSMLARTLDLAGQRWKAVANASVAMQAEPAEGWTGAIVCADEDPEGAFALCRTLRKGDARVDSILLLVSGAQLHELEHRDDLFDDFCLSPFHPKELEARFRHLLFRAGRGDSRSSRRTPTWSSTSRRIRPRSTGSRSTSPTWSTSC